MFDVLGVEEFGRKVGGLDAEVASPEDLLTLAPALVRLASQVKVGLGRVLSALERQKVCEAEFGLRADAWLARETGASKTECHRDLVTGRELARALGSVEAAVVDGDITWDHARVLAQAVEHPRVGDQVEGLADELVAMAQGTLFGQWYREVRALIELLDQDRPHDPNRELAKNQLQLVDTLDGLLSLRGQLAGEHALTVRQAIETKADELFRSATADHRLDPSVAVPARATLRALALAELCRAGTAVDPTTSKPARPEVALIVEASDPTAASDEHGVRLADGTTRTLLCDAEWYPAVVSSLGVPIDLGRKTRWATDAMRRTLRARDGGCIIPGCTIPAEWCDFHHIVPHAKGGATSIENLVMLCRRHHRLIEAGHWSIHPTSDGWYRIETPAGQSFRSQRHQHQHPGPAPSPHPRR